MALTRTAGRATAERQLVDTLVLTRDADGDGDSVFNPATGEETDPVGDTSTVYDGPGRMTMRTVRGDGSETQGGSFSYRTEYIALLPAEVVAALGDTVTVSESIADPTLEGRTFTVTQIRAATQIVLRRLTCEIVEQGERS